MLRFKPDLHYIEHYENIKEPMTLLQATMQGMMARIRNGMNDPMIAFILRINKSKPIMKLAETGKVIGDIVRIRMEMMERFPGAATFMSKNTQGVPQGGPHSPLISMLGKTISDRDRPDGMNNVENHIQYVDDGITDRAIVGDEDSGSLIQEAKTGWVKKEGK
jgi:hypothetical protein